jgi:hypothetical protein
MDGPGGDQVRTPQFDKIALTPLSHIPVLRAIVRKFPIQGKFFSI